MNDGVLLLLLGTHARPHADAGAAGVGEYLRADLVEGTDEAVAFDGVAHLLRSGRDGELRFRDQFFLDRLLREGSGARDVFVGGVGAGADQADFHFHRPAVCGGNLFHLTDWSSQVGGEGAVDVRFEFAEVDLDHFVEIFFRIGIHFRVAGEVFAHRVGQFGHIGATGGAQVAFHAGIVAEGGSGSADLGAHVTDRAFAGTAHGRRAFAEVFDDRAGSAFHGEDAGDFQDHILRAGPAVEFTGQFDADEFRPFEFPGKSGHHVAGVCTADTDGDHAEAARVHRMAVGTDHHTTGEGVVLEYHLVDDTGARLPEADAVFIGDGRKEVEDLFAFLDGKG